MDSVDTNRKKAGRKPSGKARKVVFPKRVPVELLPRLLAIVAGAEGELAAKGYVVSVVPKVSDSEHEKLKREVEELRASNKILVAMSSPDAEKDVKIADLEDRLQKTARMTDDQKCRAWIRKYDDLKAAWDAKFGASEFAQ
jgi:hypothetical protein